MERASLARPTVGVSANGRQGEKRSEVLKNHSLVPRVPDARPRYTQEKRRALKARKKRAINLDRPFAWDRPLCVESRLRFLSRFQR
jgi:hypothetical protein